MDYMELGPTPPDESCAQVGSDNYYEVARKEGARFIAGLIHYFGYPPKGYYKLRSFPHDFGDYFEVCIYWDDNDDEDVEFAYLVEANIPGTWEELENGSFK